MGSRVWSVCWHICWRPWMTFEGRSMAHRLMIDHGVIITDIVFDTDQRYVSTSHRSKSFHDTFNRALKNVCQIEQKEGNAILTAFLKCTRGLTFFWHDLSRHSEKLSYRYRNVPMIMIKCRPIRTLSVRAVKAKFHYVVSSLAGRRPAREIACEVVR